MTGDRAAFAATPEPARRLLDLIGASWITQAIATAAELGIADHLAADARTVASLAGDIKCDPVALARLMRALASLELCRELPGPAYALTDMGALLRDDGQPSLRAWALWWGRHLWPVWGQLGESVRTGRSARELATGRSGYAHVEADASAAAVFNRAMCELTSLIAAEVLRLADFGDAERIVDVGGGHGELLSAILRAHPASSGTLFDLPHALAGATERMDADGLRERCAIVGGDFFAAVPAGGDVYLLKSVLHNWDDDRCAAILRQCRRAMRAGARLMVIERALPERMSAADRAVARSDLNMLVGVGGRERTQQELRALLDTAGFAVRRVLPTALELWIVEAVATA